MCTLSKCPQKKAPGQGPTNSIFVLPVGQGRDALKSLKNIDEIKAKFQLLTNQRNQQKREVCRNCYQTGKRGILFGIPFFYKGNENWDNNIPRTGKSAEKGCIGCGWYDIERWRNELIKLITKGDD